MKQIIYGICTLLGLLLFFGLYILVALVKTDAMKYVVMIVGYVSIILFCFGFLMFMKAMRLKKVVTETKKDVSIQEQTDTIHQGE